MKWYYIANDQQVGPLTQEEFYEAVRAGKVLSETRVWCEGWANWITYAEYSVASRQPPELGGGSSIPMQPATNYGGGAATNQNKVILIAIAVVGVAVLVFSMGGESGKSRRAMTTEAIDNLDKIFKGAAYYYTAPHVNMSGSKLPCQFPAPTRICVPEGSPCDHPDNRFPVNYDVWLEATWSALSFQMNDSHYFKYCFDSRGTLSSARFTASAHADLDCDGTWSTFQRLGYGDPEATRSECAIRGSSAFYVENETE